MQFDAQDPIVPPKVDKLVRRGPGRYFLVGRSADGSPVETGLRPASLEAASDIVAFSCFIHCPPQPD